MQSQPRFEVILIDVGGVVLYDFPVEMALSYFMYRELRRERPSLKPRAADLVWAFRTGSRPPALRRIWDNAVARAWPLVLSEWPNLSFPIPSAIDAISRIGGRLAIVANQPPMTLQVLRDLGVEDLVEYIFLDSIVGISKPDEHLYRHVATSLGIEPQHALMIGDRFDNDIRPARNVGMAVGWVRCLQLDESLHIPQVPAFWQKDYLQMRPTLQVQLDARDGDWLRTAPPDFIFDDLADVAVTFGQPPTAHVC